MTIEIDPITGAPIIKSTTQEIKPLPPVEQTQFIKPLPLPLPKPTVSFVSAPTLPKAQVKIKSIEEVHGLYAAVRPLILAEVKSLVQMSGADSMSSIKLLSAIELLLDTHLG